MRLYTSKQASSISQQMNGFWGACAFKSTMLTSEHDCRLTKIKKVESCFMNHWAISPVQNYLSLGLKEIFKPSIKRSHYTQLPEFLPHISTVFFFFLTWITSVYKTHTLEWSCSLVFLRWAGHILWAPPDTGDAGLPFIVFVSSVAPPAFWSTDRYRVLEY